MQEINNNNSSLLEINENILRASGIDVHLNSDTLLKKISIDTNHNEKCREMSRYNMKNLTANEVHELTGFADIFDLLSFSIIVCGGDIETLTYKKHRLTWMEEWVLYFEYVYGRTHIRVNDYSKQWGINRDIIRKIIRNKLSMIIKVRDLWPKYATIDEDEALRKDSWNKVIKDTRARLIMHDMSNVPMDSPSATELNRATFSEYYGGNCGKGGIFTQLCGWEGALEMYTGSIGDSDYVDKSGILKEQDKFANADPEKDGTVIPFTNVFDKGYRVTLACYEHGKQLCWQPVFRKSDERYGRYATLLTAVVAHLRSGNERSVKHMKHSWFIARGTVGQPQFSLDFVADIWLGWGFQINFMYDPVH